MKRMKRTTLNATIAAVIAFTLTIGWTGIAYGQTALGTGHGNSGTQTRPIYDTWTELLYVGGAAQLGYGGSDAHLIIGSLRLGTGSTPDQTLGDDDFFVEGHLEVDGMLWIDGDFAIDGKALYDGATKAGGADGYAEFIEISGTPTPAGNSGAIYTQDNGGNTHLYYVGTGVAAIELSSAAGGNTLDSAYDQGGAGSGRKIDVDSGAFWLVVDDTENSIAFSVDQKDVTNNLDAMQISNTGTGDVIQLSGAVGGLDINATNWDVLNTGALQALSLDSEAAGTLLLGEATATKLELADTAVETEVQGTFNVLEASTFDGAVTLGNATGDGITPTGYVIADMTFNDGAGASPQLIFESQAGQQTALLQAQNAAFDGSLNLYGAKFHRDIAVTSAALMELETTNIADDYPALSIDHNGTGGVDAAEIISDSTLAALHLTTSNAAGTPLDVDVAANQTGRVANYDLGTWLGTGNEGAFHMFSDSAATIPAGQFMRLVQGGTGQHAAAISGSVFYASDAAAAPGAGTSFLAELEATNIEALLVDAGNVEIDDTLTVDGDGGGLVLNELFDLNSNANDETFHAETSAVDFAADSAFATLYLNGAGQANNTYGLRIRHATNADANDRFAVFEDNDGDDKISFNAGGAVVHSMDAGSAYAMTGTNPDTLATGMLDMEGFTVTDGYEVANLKLNALAGSGGGNEFSVLTLDVDDDTDAADTIFMINANPSDFTGSSDIIGIVTQNCSTGGSFNATAAGQGVVIDDTSSSTTTDGALDVDGSSITDTYAAARVSVVMEAGGGGNEVISGGSFETDDSSDAAGELHALRIWGDNNAGASETVGIYWEGDQDYFAKLEGATEDGNEVLLTCADVGADYTVTFGSDTGYPILSTADVDGAGGIWANASAFVFEGATADTEETTLAAIDPKQDATVNLPDYSGGLPVVIVQGTTQTSQAGVGTSDVTGTSLSLADGYFNANKALKWTIYGTITGGNAAKIIGLYIDNAMISSMTTQAATTGDFVAEFVMYEHTDYANQDVAGKLLNASDQDFEFDTDTTDFNDGGATTVKCQIQSQHAADTVTVESYRVEMWEE